MKTMERVTGREIDAMRKFIEKHAMTNRVAVCDETNAVAQEVADELGGNIISAPSGSECLTWIIPKAWYVREAYIERLDGRRIVDFKDNPLHLFSYSFPVNGVFSKKDLEEHLCYDQDRPDNIPYHYRYQYAYGQEGWGFCLRYNTYKEMKDKEYRVVIDSVLSDGEMKVADVHLQGELNDTILVAAHNCHPAQVNDGLSSVAAGLELFKYLKKRKRRYSYRLVIGPEFYAAAAFLANAGGVENIKYSIYLDMLCNNKNWGISRSFEENTYIDRIVENSMKKFDPGYVSVPYRELSGNDEFFYDGPDYYIPMVCLGRDDYPEYHLDKDDMAHCDLKELGRWVDHLKDIVRILETDFVPMRKYKGPLYFSRFGVSKDTAKDKAGAIAMDKIQILADGTNSCMDIASILNVDYDFVYDFMKQLVDKDLCEAIKK